MIKKCAIGMAAALLTAVCVAILEASSADDIAALGVTLLITLMLTPGMLVYFVIFAVCPAHNYLRHVLFFLATLPWLVGFAYAMFQPLEGADFARYFFWRMVGQLIPTYIVILIATPLILGRATGESERSN